MLQWQIVPPFSFHLIMANPDPFDPSAMEFANWRVLTIRPVFLSQILTNKKVWELRKKNSHFRGYLAFAASQTNMIWGIGRLSNVTWMPRDQLLASPAVAKHCVKPSEVNTYTHNGGGFVWEITGVRCFQSPLSWQPTPGTVIFSRVTPDLHARISSTEHIGQDDVGSPVALCEKMLVEKSKRESQKRKRSAVGPMVDAMGSP